MLYTVLVERASPFHRIIKRGQNSASTRHRGDITRRIAAREFNDCQGRFEAKDHSFEVASPHSDAEREELGRHGAEIPS